jgi:F-box and leucine-rich repeat protein 1 (S-phase kinase-associated protein 2)
LTDEHVELLLSRCPDIKELDVSDCVALTRDSIDSIITHAYNMEHLSASRCYQIIPLAYLALSE